MQGCPNYGTTLARAYGSELFPQMADRVNTSTDCELGVVLTAPHAISLSEFAFECYTLHLAGNLLEK